MHRCLPASARIIMERIVDPKTDARGDASRSASHRPTRGGRSAWILGLSLVVLVNAACVAIPPPYRSVPNYPVRFADLQSVTLVPPLVSVYAMSSGNIEQEIQEWSDGANELAKVSVRDFVEATGKTYVPFAGKRGPRPDFRLGVTDVKERKTIPATDESWLLFESVKEAVLRHTYDLSQVFPPQMSSFDYTLGSEARSLLDGTSADAFLLMIATDHVPTADRQALIGVSAAAALYTGGYGGPGGTPAELIAALVESSSGDILYFNRVSMPLSDLRDPESNKALVDLVLQGLHR